MSKNNALSPLKLPALRATMGDWVYYIAFMKIRDIAERVSFAKEIHASDTLNELLQRSVTDRSENIARYLLSQEQRFFNALVVGVYGGQPDWYELTIETKDSSLGALPGEMEGALGILKLAGSEVTWAIDGQHRVAGMRRAIEENPEVGDDEVGVIFVAGITSEHRDEDPEGYERTRRLFTTLNRYAKPVKKSDIIALDEDDVIAIVTRRLVEDYKPLRGKIAVGKTKSIPARDNKSLTSIVALYDAMDTYLQDRTASRWKDFKTLRPSDDEIDSFYQRAVEFWTLIGQHFPAVHDLLDSKPSEEIAGEYRNSQGGHLLFRPIGLLLAAKILYYLVGDGASPAEAVQSISRVPMTLSEKPWAGLLWDTRNNRMITAPENQKVARWLLFYSVGGDVGRFYKTITDVKKEYAGLLNRDPEEIEIPRFD